MDVLISPGRDFYIIWKAQAKWLRVGKSMDILTREYYPSIEILYQKNDIPKILLLAQEMERRHVAPQVYIITRKHVYVAIIFRLRTTNMNFLFQALPNKLHKLVAPRVAAGKPVHIITTGETEYPSKDSVKPFLFLYDEKKFFRLLLIEELEGNAQVLWGAQLSTFKTNWPHI